MYIELTAKDERSLRLSFWEAEVMGLDPQYTSQALTFGIGTGSIEKVSNIRDKYNLKETYWSDAEPTGYVRR